MPAGAASRRILAVPMTGRPHGSEARGMWAARQAMDGIGVRTSGEDVPGKPGPSGLLAGRENEGVGPLASVPVGVVAKLLGKVFATNAGKQPPASACSPDGCDRGRSCAQRRGALQVGAASWCDASTLSRWAPRETKRKPGTDRKRTLGDEVEYRGRSYPSLGSRARVRQLRQ